MPLLYGHDAEVAAWAEGKMGGRLVFPHAALGMLDARGVLKGAFLFAFHNRRTAELTLYSEGVISNGMWREAMQFAFRTLDLTRLQIRTSRRNRAVKKAAPKFGFRFEGVARDFWGPGDDALLYYMTPATCRWMGHNGKSVRHARRTEGAQSNAGRELAV